MNKDIYVYLLSLLCTIAATTGICNAQEIEETTPTPASGESPLASSEPTLTEEPKSEAEPNAEPETETRGDSNTDSHTARLTAKPEIYPEPERAQTVLSNEEKQYRRFALGVSLVKEHSIIGIIARLRFNHIAAEVAYGIMPVLLFYQHPSGVLKTEVELSYIHFDGGIIAFFSDQNKRFQNGIRFSGVYDLIMGPGGMLGWVGEFTWQRFTIGLGAGIQFYPIFDEDRLREHFDVPSNISLDDAAQLPTWLQPYFGLNFLWYFT